MQKKKDVRFSLLLFALSILLKWSAKNNNKFKRYIRKGKTRVMIKTADGKRARLFVFDNGKVHSRTGNTKEYDVALIWKNANIGYKGMLNKEKDASFNAAANGDLKIDGMSVYAQWFENGMKLINI